MLNVESYKREDLRMSMTVHLYLILLLISLVVTSILLTPTGGSRLVDNYKDLQTPTASPIFQ